MKRIYWMDRTSVSLPFHLVIVIILLLTPCRQVWGGISDHQDTAYIRQQLYNGRIWQDRYSRISGNEFFITEALSGGSVTVKDRKFSGLLLRYDIYNDRPVLMVKPDLYIEVNTETTDEFSMTIMNREYRFINLGSNGFYHILYRGNTSLFVKYRKEIKKNAVQNTFDAFVESESVYLMKNGNLLRINKKGDLLKALDDRHDEVRAYLRKNRLQLTVKEPESMVSLLQYYNTL